MSKGGELHLYIESEISRDHISAKDLKCYNTSLATYEGPDKGLGIASSTNYLLRDDDEKIIKILKKFTAWSNIELKIYDLANKEEKKKAKSNGIKSAPLILIDNRKITLLPSDEDSLLRLLGVGEKERKELISREPTLTVSIEGDVVCKNCGSHNLKIYSDGSGFCPECKKAYQTVR